jgi:hypothetical protein
MGTGYTRNDTGNNIADGNVINASDLDGEFDAVQSAFNGSSGHSHDGTTGEGPQIATAGIADANVTTAKLADDAVTPAKLQDSGTFQVGQMNAGGDGSSAGTTIKDAKIEVRSGSSAVPAIDLYCEVTNQHKVTIKSPPHADYSGNVTFQLPSSNGSNGQFLQTNGSGVLSYATVDTDLSNDSTPQLAGNLDTNSHNILIDDAHFIGDENGNEQIIFQTTSSAVNQIDITNAATGNAPSISATGDDTNIGLTLTPKGSGAVVIDGLSHPTADGSANQFLQTNGSGTLSFATVDLTAINIVTDTSPQLGGNLDTNSQNILIDDAHFIGDENGNEQIIFQTTSSAVNQIDVTNAATGNGPSITATGGDTNIDLNLSGKGSGVTAIGGAATVAGTVYATGNIGLDSTDYIAWTNNTQMDFYVNGANDMRLESDGDLHVEGDVVAFSTTVASDPRLKENVEQVTDAVAKVEQLTGYTFDYKHGGASAGVMSTEVAQVLPSAVSQTTLPLKTGDEETEYDVVAYDQLHALLIEAVKELSARVKELENGSNG